MSAAWFRAAIARNPNNGALLECLAPLGLPQCYLTAGCLFQTAWNVLSDRPPTENIKDYDVFYFDPDTSWEAEDRVIRRVAEATRALGLAVEVKNQARVHLWYPQRFGRPYPQLTTAEDGIGRYLVACTCVGIAVADRRIFAPDGYDDLRAGRLRPNPKTPYAHLSREKAASYRSRWPWLTVFAE